jgi:hypothetical protein
MLGREDVGLTVSLTELFMRVGCLQGRSLGSPCVSFDAGAEGVSKRDGWICDVLTTKANGIDVNMSSCRRE